MFNICCAQVTQNLCHVLGNNSFCGLELYDQSIINKYVCEIFPSRKNT